MRRRASRSGALAALAAALVLVADVPRAPASQWYKADLHSHSVLSSDAHGDLGILARAARQAGFHAVFLTDHNLGSSFPISQATANNVALTEVRGSRWDQGGRGTCEQSANEMSPARPQTGEMALDLACVTSTAGEASVYAKRGPLLASGGTVLRFSVFPTRVDPGSGLYVSASIGGDPVVQGALGYTTEDGTVSPGKSTTFVWQLGQARAPSSDPNRRVVVTDLEYRLDEWNTYEIDLAAALAGLPAADRPDHHAAWTYVKLAATGSSGGATGHFDDISAYPTAPRDAAVEFADRNGRVGAHDTSTFKLLPGMEMGVRQHAGRLHFPSTDPADFRDWYRGVDGIPWAQEAGHPAVLNHPGEPGGVEAEDAIATAAFGADAMEVRKTAWADVWDAILRGGRFVTGIGSTDTHRGYSASSWTTRIYAPSLDADALLRQVFEGRVIAAVSDYTGHAAFNLDPSSSVPYPARWPVFVSDAETSIPVHLAIASGISSGSTVSWRQDGTEFARDPTSGTSYDATRSVSLSGASPRTYVRAELMRSADSSVIRTQPIMFRDVPGLPAGTKVQVLGVQTLNGRDYVRTKTKGITDTSFDAVANRLSARLENPVGAITRLQVTTSRTPSAPTVDGVPLLQASSEEELDTLPDSAWYYDPGTRLVLVKVRQSGSANTLAMTLGESADTEAPTTPGGFTATALDHTSIRLRWSPSTDDRAVAGYRVKRNGVVVAASLPAGQTQYDDGGLTASTRYEYAIEAFDDAGNRSAPAQASATTAAVPCTTVGPVADAYTNSDSATKNYGLTPSVRADASPVQRGFLRFDVTGPSTPVVSARLTLTMRSASSVGFRVHRLADTSWSETAVTHDNAPAVGTAITSSGAVQDAQRVALDVTPAVTGTGPHGFALTTTATVGMAMGSRESATPPELEVCFEPLPPGAQPPTRPGSFAATAMDHRRVRLSWTASTDDVGVEGYRLERDGVPVATLPAWATDHEDTGLSPGTTYTYELRAFDGGGMVSEPASASARTASVTCKQSIAVADAYVDASRPDRSFGALESLRVDGDPVVRSFARFDVPAFEGTVLSAAVTFTARSDNTVGFRLHAVADSTWTEQVTHATAPAVGAEIGASGRVVTGQPYTIDVTSAVQAAGPRSFALTSTSTTASAYSSREGTTPPRLEVCHSDATAPTSPAPLQASARDDRSVRLSWSEAMDADGIAEYQVQRDGATIARVPGTETAYTDTDLEPGTTYNYAVYAVDPSGNRSGAATVATATKGVVCSTLTPVADTYTAANWPARNFGGNATFRTDGDPVQRGWLRFDVPLADSTPVRAVLSLRPTADHTAGVSVHAVEDDAWTESGLTHETAPSVGAVLGETGRLSNGTRAALDVTSAVTAGRPRSFAITTASTTAAPFASRETGADGPALEVCHLQ